MVGSKDLPPSTLAFFPTVFYNNQYKAIPKYPSPSTSLTGQTAIITGSNTGLGYEAARQLLSLSLSTIILAVRSPAKGEAAAITLRKEHPNARIMVWELDMRSYDSVQAFAKKVERDLKRVDMVVLNAGVSRMKFGVVEATGHEETVQVNYLSTILLAILLLPVLKKKSPPNQPARLTIVSAALTLAAKFPNSTADPLIPSFDDPAQFSMEQYNSSKLLAHMFLWKLVDYVSASSVIVNLADPAWCRGTRLGRDATGAMWAFLKLFGMTGRTPAVGASCFVDAVVDKGRESHGCFLMSWEVHPFAAMLYTPEGQVVIDRLWEETMAELEFAGVRQILNEMRG